MVNKTISMKDAVFNEVYNFANKTLKVSTSKAINYFCQLSLPIFQNQELYQKLRELVIEKNKDIIDEMKENELISKKIIELCEFSLPIFKNKELYEKVKELINE